MNTYHVYQYDCLELFSENVRWEKVLETLNSRGAIGWRCIKIHFVEGIMCTILLEREAS